MKIDAPVVKISTPSTGTTQLKSGKLTEVSLVNKSASSNVQISGQLQALVSQSGDGGSFNAQKVMEIKTAIAEGRFQVNAGAVTDGLIATAKDLIQSQSRIA